MDILHTNLADQCDPMSSVYMVPGTEEKSESEWMRVTASVAKQVVSLSACVDENVCGIDRFASVHMELSMNQLRERNMSFSRNKVVKTICRIRSHPQGSLTTNGQN